MGKTYLSISLILVAIDAAHAQAYSTGRPAPSRSIVQNDPLQDQGGGLRVGDQLVFADFTPLRGARLFSEKTLLLNRRPLQSKLLVDRSPPVPRNHSHLRDGFGGVGKDGLPLHVEQRFFPHPEITTRSPSRCARSHPKQDRIRKNDVQRLE